MNLKLIANCVNVGKQFCFVTEGLLSRYQTEVILSQKQRRAIKRASTERQPSYRPFMLFLKHFQSWTKAIVDVPQRNNTKLVTKTGGAQKVPYRCNDVLRAVSPRATN